jgi:hypothetical protein
MLERQRRPAQDFIENAPRHPQHQSREAGSCLGGFLTFSTRRSIAESVPELATRWPTTSAPVGVAPASPLLFGRSPWFRNVAA